MRIWRSIERRLPTNPGLTVFVGLTAEGGIVVKDHVQQEIVDFEVAVVLDEPSVRNLFIKRESP